MHHYCRSWLLTAIKNCGLVHYMGSFRSLPEHYLDSFLIFFSRFKFPLCPNIFKFLSIKNNCQLHNENTPVLFLLHQLKSPLSSKSFSMSSGLFPKSFLPHQAKWRYTCLCIEAVLHNFYLSNKDPSISSRYLATSSAIDWSLPSCLTFLMRRITLE